MIDFIFGDAGSGKSTYIYKWITQEAESHPDRSYFLFVPEQHTLKAQRELIRYSSRNGMLNLDVLSFQLLAYRVMDELGIEKPVMLDEVSKSILIRKAVIEAADELEVYKRKINSAGFVNQIKSLISELYQYDVDIDRLKEAGRESGVPLLSAKINDVYTIYKHFRDKLTERAVIPEETAYLLLSYISASALLNDAVVVFDSYTGFTPIQIKIIEHIMTKAARVRFSVTIPREAGPYRSNNDISDLYWMSRETVSALCKAGERNSVKNAGEVYINNVRKHIDVQIVSAESPLEEARIIVHDLHRSALIDNTRYMRSGIVLADPASYSELIKNEMDLEGVPYFIDDRSDAVGNPVVEYIRRALRSISSNYKYEDLMAFVRCPLISGTAKEKEDADKFDNFLRKTGLRGRTALKSGKLDYDFGLLTSLEDGLKAANDIAGMTEALKAFCLASELKSRADSFSDNTEALGFARQADECRRFTKLIPELFDRMTIVLGDEQCSVNDYIRLIDAGFHEIKGGMIPETMDMVMIGDLKRSRFDDIDVLYVLGANDGNIPSEVSGGGIFTDFERGIIQSTNIELAPDDKLDSCIQHFYLKLLLNKPNKRLVITYARTGRDNKGLKPSSMLDELENKVYGEFDSISSMLGDQTEVISSKEDALMSFAGGLSKIRKEDDRAVSIYKALSRGGMKAELDKILAAAFLEHKLDKIPEETAAELYNDVLRGSVTRIENFEACPFVHFIQHGLGLREREEHSFEVLDAGNVFHEALDRIFRHIRREKKDIVSIEAEELEAICNSEIDSVINEYNDGIMNSSMRIKYFANKIRKITNKTVTVLRTQLSEGDFHNAETEAVFSFRDGSLDLYGKIDRIDKCETDGRTLVKIIDYKSGKKEFSISRLADGLELQLITYMGSAVKKISDLKGKDAEVVPAGMFYYHIADPEIEYEPGLHRDNIDDKKLAELRMHGAMIADTQIASHVDHRLDIEQGEVDKNAVRQSGVVSSGTELLSRDEFETLIKYASDKIRSDARDILSGDINIRPLREANKEKCRYCSFHGICRFDTGIPGFEYRNVKKCSRDEAMARIQKAIKGDGDTTVSGSDIMVSDGDIMVSDSDTMVSDGDTGRETR